MKRHEDWLNAKLQDPGFAAEYLTAAAEDTEPAVYLAALRSVAEAQGMAEVAKRAGIPRESLCCPPVYLTGSRSGYFVMEGERSPG